MGASSLGYSGDELFRAAVRTLFQAHKKQLKIPGSYLLLIGKIWSRPRAVVGKGKLKQKEA